MNEHTQNPTYKFEVGDKVTCGGFSEVTVVKVYDDYLYYDLKCISRREKYGKIQTTEKIATKVEWYQCRPIVEPSQLVFTDIMDMNSNVYTKSIDSVLFQIMYWNTNLSPSYQRDYVWTMQDREKLITSIFQGIKIGEVTLRHFEFKDTNYDYEVIDGKQRLSALLDFYLNRYPYKGVYYNELSYEDKYTFMNTLLPVVEIREKNDIKIAEYFVKINTTGKVMSEEDLERANKLLKGKQS